MTAPRKPCEDCGRVDGHHDWVEGDCVLPHRTHSRKLLAGTFVCVWCVKRHRDWLRDILDLYATLTDVVLAGSVPDETAEHQHVKKSADTPVPIRLAAWALAFDAARMFTTGAGTDLPDIPAVLTSWAQNACDEQGLAGASLDSTLSTAVKLLDAHAERIAGFGWVDEYDAELGWCRTALRRAHGITGGRRPVGKCPSLDGDGVECGGPLWPNLDDGGMSVDCGTCKRHFDERFLRLLGGMIAS